nr:hypothetical protein [uncultured Chryseobacterium sp.]
MEGTYEYIAAQRTAFYNSGSWVDNLGNIRSIRYAGRDADSQIGLRGNYLRTTAMYGKYAKRVGWVGNVISVGEVTYASYEDGWSFGKNTQIATAKAIGGLIGASEGALLGAYIGTFIPLPGAGTLLGAGLGFAVGYLYGEIAGQVVENIQKN